MEVTSVLEEEAGRWAGRGATPSPVLLWPRNVPPHGTQTERRQPACRQSSVSVWGWGRVSAPRVPLEPEAGACGKEAQGSKKPLGP